MNSPRRFCVIATLLAVLSPSAAFSEPAVPSADELLTCLGIDRAKKSKLMAGELLSTPVEEGSDKELAVGMVMFVKAPVEKLASFVKNGMLLSSDKTVTAFGELKKEDDISAMSGVVFGPKQLDEAKELLDASSGSQFNLSATEIRTCRNTKVQGKGPDAIRATASKLYQQILFDRYTNFLRSGLSGVAVYDRPKRPATPADELRLATKQSTLFAKHFPEMEKALLDYPANQPPGVVNRFFWVNQIVEKRPTFILMHRMSMARPQGAIMVERQFYVGHSYNSLQTITGCIAVPGGSLVFHSNHTSTDQVAGFGSGLRHSIGRDQMRDETFAGFEQLRATVTAR